MALKKERLIVDGYNMIGSWPALVKLKNRDEIEEARDSLLEQLSNYVGYHGIETWVVFDAMFVPGISKSYDQFNLHVVFTSEGQTADSYIEEMIADLVSPIHNVTVATSDLAEQRMVFQKGALRQSAQELYRAIQKTNIEITHGSNDYEYNKYQRSIPWSVHQLDKLGNFYKNLTDKKDE
ncbi:NYN domain-containing protein [Aerococcus agrisoli]|uniref:NYN domain-containing protein n=1 Tax=Aerococcus agrisoli TaxID=2487350 RepID=A0A3N4GP83_9LACT|nr:NYN domain-containing protein [Aerococcus agrisoli]RPA60911.1 NYN domain-containing protein [Aerococcus agrisoli]